MAAILSKRRWVKRITFTPQIVSQYFHGWCFKVSDKNTSFPDGCLPLGFFMLVDKHNLPLNCCLDKIEFSSLTVWLYSYNSANIWCKDMKLIALENMNDKSLTKSYLVVFVVVWYSSILPMLFRVISLTLGQSIDWMIAPVPVKLTWRVWVNVHMHLLNSDNVKKQNITMLCTYVIMRWLSARLQ